MTELTHAQWSAVHRLLLALYASEDLDEVRRLALAGAAELVPHSKSFFDLGASRGDRMQFFSPLSLNMTDEELRRYYSCYQASDYTSWLFRPGEALVYRDSQVVSDALRESTLIYRNWMEPMGVYYGLGCSLAWGGRLYGSLTLFRGRAAGDFTDAEFALLEVLNAHLSLHFGKLWPGGLRPRAEKAADESLLVERYSLTAREYEVLRQVCGGAANREIAAALFISENTVKKHVNSIFRKLAVTSRAQLLNRVYEGR